MIFSSFEFVVFFAALVAALACLRSESGRRNLLLAASYAFYAWWDWRFCGLVLASTVVDFLVAWRIHAAPPRTRRRWLWLSLAFNLGVLALFKYADFFLDSLAAALPGVAETVPHLDLVLPIGISFYTFQTLSYTLDVYRGNLAPTRSFRDFALFVAFFPQLVAGPIVRAGHFLPQLDRVHPLRGANLRQGLAQFLRGFTKKVLFADTLALLVDPVFAAPEAFSPATCWLAAVGYAGQIYYDFSGYTDMAIGVGRALGFELPVNFQHPYLSRNLAEFWRRWHISLSTWLRDYLYIALGGNRAGSARTAANLLLTMLLGGLWHGAAWTFVAWGAMHGVALVAYRFALASRRGVAEASGSRVRALASWAATFAWVLIGWVVFRSESFALAVTMLRKLAFLAPGGIVWLHVPSLVVIAMAVGLHVGTVLRQERPWSLDLRSPFQAAAAVLLLVILLLFAPIETSPFIYFQF